MKNIKGKTFFTAMILSAILIFGSVAVHASTGLSPGTPLAPEGWTLDDDELDSIQRPRAHIMRLVIGQYAYTQNGIDQISDAAPFIAENRTMVPLRLIAEAMGAEVRWDRNTRTVTITQGTTILTLVIDQPLPDGLGTPVINNGRTFVPLEFVAESLGVDVEWDSATQSIEVIWVWQTVNEGEGR